MSKLKSHISNLPPYLLKRLILIFSLLPFFLFFRSVYRDRVGAFGCFDDCFNIGAGYFLLQGKHLFSEIFFNHQPLMAYVSAAIQAVTHPSSMYDLIFQHRMFLVYFFISMDILLILRFGLAGVFFTLIYEATKGYIFGERFLAEAMIVYPIVYLIGLAWESIQNKNINKYELALSSVFTWFIVFMREPYVPVGMFLFLIIIWHSRRQRAAGFTTIGFTILSLLTIFYHNPNEYWFNVITINSQTVAKQESGQLFSAMGIFRLLASPVSILLEGSWNQLRILEVVLAGAYLGFSSYYLFIKRHLRLVTFFWLTLALANMRPVIPGTMYYGAFHSIVWLGVLIFSVGLFCFRFPELGFLNSGNRKRFIYIITLSYFGLLVLFALFHKNSYLYEKINRNEEFTTNYASHIVPGEIIHGLSDETDTIFVEEWEDMVYWQAKRPSSYHYSWYTSVMPSFERYRFVREEMFTNSPPDFYFSKCVSNVVQITLPTIVNNDYERLYSQGKPTCLWIKKNKIPEITNEQWKTVEKYNYYVPATEQTYIPTH